MFSLQNLKRLITEYPVVHGAPSLQPISSNESKELQILSKFWRKQKKKKRNWEEKKAASFKNKPVNHNIKPPGSFNKMFYLIFFLVQP